MAQALPIVDADAHVRRAAAELRRVALEPRAEGAVEDLEVVAARDAFNRLLHFFADPPRRHDTMALPPPPDDDDDRAAVERCCGGGMATLAASASLGE